MSSASASAAVTSCTGSELPGATGTPAADIVSRASILSLIARIAEGGGPTQVIPAATTCSAKSALSLRKP